jgi:hypothetical protein
MDTTTDTTDPWLTREEVAARWKAKTKTLAQWASRNRGPAFQKFGGLCRYRLSDVIAWENAQTTRGAGVPNPPSPMPPEMPPKQRLGHSAHDSDDPAGAAAG